MGVLFRGFLKGGFVLFIIFFGLNGFFIKFLGGWFNKDFLGFCFVGLRGGGFFIFGGIVFWVRGGERIIGF